MKILAIESSCDETATAIIENQHYLISNSISSQIKIHQKYGGVVPELASRNHLYAIIPLLEDAIKPLIKEDSKTSKAEDYAKYISENIDAIAVTKGPGLMGSLLVGVMAAKTLAMVFKKPLIGVHHIEGHIFANFLKEKTEENKTLPSYPFVCLVVSGGHTDLVYVEKESQYTYIGRTRDDAAGECFDKAARYLGLGYPGGPIIEKVAQKGNPYFLKFPKVNLRSNQEDCDLDFSFSGLKTEVTMYKEKLPINASSSSDKDRFFSRAGKRAVKNISLPDLTACLQESIVNILVDNTVKAAKKCKTNTILMAGGVSANRRLREVMASKCHENNLKLFYPPIKYCTDNAAMIAAAAYPKLLKKSFDDFNLTPASRINL